MQDATTLLKINGLIYLLLGALLVFLPPTIIYFLSETNPAPTVAMLGTGVGFNLLGLLLLWLANQTTPSPQWIKLTVVIDLLLAAGIFGLILMNIWVTTINGITAAGLVAIVLAWFAWLQWQHLANQTKSP